MIGVIGANGVAATNRLQFLIEDGLTRRGAFRDAHHPEMIIWQATQVPSRSMYLEGRGPSFIEPYVEIGKRLRDLGCDTLCMCCNTAHYAVETLEQQIGLPFLNIIDLVAEEARQKEVKKIGVMCSDGCLKTDLYGKSFARYCPDAEIVYPSAEYQTLVTKGICNAKNLKRYLPDTHPGSPVQAFSAVTQQLIQSGGVTCIVAGCTDINAVFSPEKFHNLFPDITYIDSLKVLADTIINRHEF